MGLRLLRLVTVTGAAIAVALSIGAGPSAAQKNTQTVRGEAHTLDGFVVPGQSVVLVVSEMPDKLVFQLPVGPGFRVPRCRDPYVCEPTIAQRPDGGFNFHTDEEGRATITFVMPSSFVRRNLKTGGKKTLHFREGDGVRIQANGFRGKVEAVAVAKARIGG